MTYQPKRGGPRAMDWDKVLAPPPGLAGPAQTLTGGGWEVRLVRGVGFGTSRRPGATPFGMAQMVRNWAGKLGYGASVRVERTSVVARLWRK